MSADRIPNSEPAAALAPDDRSAIAALSTASESLAGSPVRVRQRAWPVIVGIAVVVGGLLWLTGAWRDQDLRPVQNGRRFSHAERRQAESALRAAGIDVVRAGGSQLHVASDALAAADQALTQAELRPSDSASRWQTVNSIFDQFATGRRREQAESAARAAQVARQLEEQPAVSSAEIVWDEEPQAGRRRLPRARATVFLKPAAGCTIGLDTVHAVRMAVAGSRAHLTPADVVVMDLQRQVTYDAPQDPQALAYEAHQAELTGTYRTRIESALADFPGVRVFVRLHDAAAMPSDRTRNVETPPSEGARLATGSLPAGVLNATRSGPNLRLEVPPGPFAAPVIATQPTIAASGPIAEAMTNVDVEVDVPAGAVAPDAAHNDESRLGREKQVGDRGTALPQKPFDIRQQVALAVARSLPSRAGVNLTVRFDAPPISAVQAELTSPHASSSIWTWFGPVNGWDSLPAHMILMLLMSAAALIWLARRSLVRGGRGTVQAARAQRAPAAESLTAIDQRSVEANRASGGFFPGIDAADWTPIAARESSQVVAGLLRALGPDEVAHLIAQLSPARQREVLALTPSAAILGDELGLLRQRILAQLESLPRTSGMPRRWQRGSGRRRADVGAEASATVVMPEFEALSRADDASLRALIDKVPTETWSAALVAAPDLRLRLSQVCGSGGRFHIPRDHRPMRLHDIESAQRLILDEWRSLNRPVGSDPGL